MNVSWFDYTLPEELIAQTPIVSRSQSRMMVMDRASGAIEHTRFSSIVDDLHTDDVLVLNDSRVRPARLIGEKEGTGAKIELLLCRPYGGDRWEALVKPAKRVKLGTRVCFGDGELVAIAQEAGAVPGSRIFQLEYQGNDIEKLLVRLGKMPLPPYIHEQLEDPERYQTVYSRVVGSAAAPTAGLHFTEEILQQLHKKGVRVVPLTLHVGIGTFRPVTAESVEDHVMHSEYYSLDATSAQVIQEAKQGGKRIIAVGTTTVRTLETIASRHKGKIQADAGWTDIFIYPGYSFQVVEGMITNFHLPQSTLLMLVSAFSSRDLIMQAYQQAVKHRYRFFSFGDAMFLR